MTKKSLLTKAARGIQNGDVANAMVRNLLNLLSDKAVTEDDIKEAIKFFEYKCPYTGEKLPINDVDNISDEQYDLLKQNFQLDHIIPQNRECCGLNVRGNLVYVLKEANSKKSSKNYDKFIREENEVKGLIDLSEEERQKRIAKIEEFQKITGYNSSMPPEKVKKVSEFLNDQYNSIAKKQNERISKIKKIIEG